jgi:RNA polymerase sigma factor (sigma-70 family)
MLTKQEYTAAVERYLDMVYRLARSSLSSAADAEDAAQETMLRLWNTDAVFQGDDHLRHWLVRVCVNVCRDHARSAWRRRVISLEECRDPIFSDPTYQNLWEEVSALPAKYRQPLYLYYYEGYSVAEVAELLELKVSTVQTRLARAREKLKTQLTEV